MINFIIKVIFFLLLFAGCANERHDFWAKTYGTKGPDGAGSVLQTSDGSYIVSGSCARDVGFSIIDPDYTDYEQERCIFKLNSFGEVEWSKMYISSFNSFGIKQAAGIGFIMGSCKFSASGEIEWALTIPEHASSFQQTSDSGYVIAGVDVELGPIYDVFVMKLDSERNVEWQKSYGGPLDEYINNIKQTSDEGYIIAASNDSFTPGGPWVLKLDSNGLIQWEKMYINRNGYIFIDSIWQTIGDSYISTGSIELEDGNIGIFIMKLDSMGLVQGQINYSISADHRIVSIQQTLDEGFILGGSIYQDPEDYGLSDEYDFFIIKLSASGDIEWQRIYGGDGKDRFGSIQQVSDGGFIIGGSTDSFGTGRSDAWILRLTENGIVPGICQEIKAENILSFESEEILVYPVGTTATVKDTDFTIYHSSDTTILNSGVSNVKLNIHTQCTGDLE